MLEIIPTTAIYVLFILNEACIVLISVLSDFVSGIRESMRFLLLRTLILWLLRVNFNVKLSEQGF
jgi:hypothetical protein